MSILGDRVFGIVTLGDARLKSTVLYWPGPGDIARNTWNLFEFPNDESLVEIFSFLLRWLSIEVGVSYPV